MSERRRSPLPATLGLPGSEVELAWAAGLWDGEGSAGCYFGRSNVKGYLQATLAQNDPEVLYRFRDAVGGGAIYRKLFAFQWHISRYHDVVELALRLNPHLGTVKREQFARAISEYHSRRSS